MYPLGSTQAAEQRQPEDVPLEAMVQFTRYIRFVSRDPAKNRNRFYLLSWQPTLDGSAALVCSWGRLGTRGRSRMLCAADQPNAQDVVARIIRRRVQRGYQVIEWR
jgi:predicted DNA-binding WGR domain protein